MRTISDGKTMNKDEFKAWILQEYSAFDYNHFALGMPGSILDYADGMNAEEQYTFLCMMIPEIPESVIRQVSY